MADQTQNPQNTNPQGGAGMPSGGTPIPPPAAQAPQGGTQQSSAGVPMPPINAPTPPLQGGFAAPQGIYPPTTGGFGSPTPPSPQPEDTTPANFQLGIKLPPKLNVPVPQHNLKFDEQYFLRLLAGSISLTKDEKKRIIESIPKLKQAQIDELIKIFEDEKRKFAELSKKYTDQLEKLAQKHFEDWTDLEASYKQQEKASHDAQQADEIRKKLGLG